MKRFLVLSCPTQAVLRNPLREGSQGPTDKGSRLALLSKLVESTMTQAFPQGQHATWRWVLASFDSSSFRFRDLLTGRQATVPNNALLSYSRWIREGLTTDPLKQFPLQVPTHVCLLLPNFLSKQVRLLQQFASNGKPSPKLKAPSESYPEVCRYHISLDRVLTLLGPEVPAAVQVPTPPADRKKKWTAIDVEEAKHLANVQRLCEHLAKESDRSAVWAKLLSADGVCSPIFSPIVVKPIMPKVSGHHPVVALRASLREALLPLLPEKERDQVECRVWIASHLKGVLQLEELLPGETPQTAAASPAVTELPVAVLPKRLVNVVFSSNEICRVLLLKLPSLSDTDAVVRHDDLERVSRKDVRREGLANILRLSAKTFTTDEWRMLLRVDRGVSKVSDVLRKPKPQKSNDAGTNELQKRLSRVEVAPQTTARLVRAANFSVRDHLKAIYGCPARLALEEVVRSAYVSCDTSLVTLDVESEGKTFLLRKDNPFFDGNAITKLVWKWWANAPETAVGDEKLPKLTETADLRNPSANVKSTQESIRRHSSTVFLGADIKRALLFLHRVHPTLVGDILSCKGTRIWCVFYAQFLLSGFRGEFISVDQLWGLYFPQTSSRPSDPNALLHAVFRAQLRAAVRGRVLLMIRERMEGLLATVAMECAGLALSPPHTVQATKSSLDLILSAGQKLLQKYFSALLQERLPHDESLQNNVLANFNWRSGADVAAFLFGGGMVRLAGRLPKLEHRLSPSSEPSIAPSKLFTFLRGSPTRSSINERAASSFFIVANLTVKDDGLISRLSLHFPTRDSAAQRHWTSPPSVQLNGSDFDVRLITNELKPIARSEDATTRHGELMTVDECKRRLLAHPILAAEGERRREGKDRPHDVTLFVLTDDQLPKSLCMKCTSLVESGLAQTLCQALGVDEDDDVSFFPLPSMEHDVVPPSSQGDGPLVVDFDDFKTLAKGETFVEAREEWKQKLAVALSRVTVPPSSDPAAATELCWRHVRGEFLAAVQKDVSMGKVSSSRYFAEGRNLEQRGWSTVPRVSVQEKLSWPGVVWPNLKQRTAEGLALPLKVLAVEGDATLDNVAAQRVHAQLEHLLTTSMLESSSGTPSVGTEMLESLIQIVRNVPDVDVKPPSASTKLSEALQLLLQSRGHEKLHQLFVPDRLLFAGIPAANGGLFIHGEVLHTKTNTGRLASQTPCIHNIPKHKAVRSLFPSRFGDKGCIVEADYTQLEVVALAVLSRDQQMLEELRQNTDFHCMRVSLMRKEPYEQVVHKVKVEKDPAYIELRQAAKVFSFQRQYGAGIDSICKSTGLPKSEVTQLIAAEEGHYPQLTAYYRLVADSIRLGNAMTLKDRVESASWTPEARQVQLAVEPMNYFMTFTGTKYHLPANSSIPLQKNHPVQGFAGELVQMVCGRVMRKLYAADYHGKAFLVNCVHDCVWVDCLASVSDVVAADIREVMESVVPLWRSLYGESSLIPDVAFPVTVHRGTTLGDLAPISSK